MSKEMKKIEGKEYENAVKKEAEYFIEKNAGEIREILEYQETIEGFMEYAEEEWELRNVVYVWISSRWDTFLKSVANDELETSFEEVVKDLNDALDELFKEMYE